MIEYQSLSNVTKDQAEIKLDSARGEELCLLLLSLSELDDWEWVQNVYLKYVRTNRTPTHADYMLTALSIDPALSQKRMGDGFYEQQLIREQISKLTGRRYLAGYSSNEERYKALMSAGITFALEYELTPAHWIDLR